MSTTRSTAALALALLAALPAAAQDNTVRLGMFLVTYDAKAGDVAGPYTPPGLNLKVDSITTPYLAYLRRFTDHLQAELAVGVPPTTRTVGKGPARVGSVPFDGQELGTSKWLSPSLLGEYVFLDPGSPVRPYVGVGVNFTRFFDNTSTQAGNEANGGPTSIRLTNSWGPAATLGLSFNLGGRWSAIASYSYARIRSDYTSDTSGVVRTTTIDFRPSAWVVAAGYSF